MGRCVSPGATLHWCHQALTEDADAAQAEVARLEQADICQMWADDLELFMEVHWARVAALHVVHAGCCTITVVCVRLTCTAQPVLVVLAVRSCGAVMPCWQSLSLLNSDALFTTHTRLVVQAPTMDAGGHVG